jgi:N-methylhydantoinase B
MNLIEPKILWSRLISAVDESAATLVRTSFSPVVRDSLDFGCVLLDAKGELVAQSTLSNPSFVGTLRFTARYVLEKFSRESIVDGDSFITNDPWLATGHLPDITIITPIFMSGELIAFSACGAHQADIGGRIRSADAREIYEEGLRIPIQRFCRAGVLNGELMEIIEANVRVPDMVRGDLIAQLAANEMCASRLREIVRELALSDPAAVFDEIINITRQAMTQAITDLPEGVSSYEVMNDGIDGKAVRIAARVAVRSGRILVDYDGTSAQVGQAINVVPNYTYAYTVYPLKVVLNPNIPNNEGVFSCIDVSSPLGSILNPRFPCAVGARTLVGQMLSAAVFGALSQVIPDRVPAPGGAPAWGATLSGIDDTTSRPFALTFFLSPGLGATAEADGRSCTNFPTNISATPVEVIEQSVPLRVRSKRIARGTGGAGKHRGGDGQSIIFEVLQDINASFLAERLRYGAPGLHGGEAGACGVMTVDGVPIDPKQRRLLTAGQVVEMQTPGGGGFAAAAPFGGR